MGKNNTEKYLYIIREKKFIKKKENIYKIGKPVGRKEFNHLCNYSKGEISSLLNCKNLEETIISEFKNKFKFREDIGVNYFEFEGNIDQLRNEMSRIFQMVSLLNYSKDVKTDVNTDVNV